MLKMPRVRMAQLQTLTENVVRITENLTEVAPQVQSINTAFITFQEGMTKSASASNKKTLDRSRDLLNSGLFRNIEAEALFPHDSPVVSNAVDEVVTISQKYGLELNRLSYDEQTAETDNLIAELEALDLGLLPNIERWIPFIKAANNSFKETVEAYLEDQTEASDTKAATIAAIPLENSLHELFTMLFAHVNVTQTEALIVAYKELTTLINSYR